MNNLKVMSIDELKKRALGEVIELPGWGEEPFVARLKRPSILALAEKGKIPNELLSAATKIFTNGISSKGSNTDLKELNKLLNIFAEIALAEPTTKDLEDAGIELTYLQLLAIYNYTQMGARALKPFRADETSSEDNKPSK